MAFPSLVGGTLVREDLAPSIIFAILFGSLIPVAAFRLLQKGSRTTLVLGTLAFAIERVAIFSLRAVQSQNPTLAVSSDLTTYEQLTIGVGFIRIAQDLVNFLRVLLVRATQPSCNGESTNSRPDRPRERAGYRRLTGFLKLAFLAAIVPGFISAGYYPYSFENPDHGAHLMKLRHASAGVSLLLTIVIALTAWAAINKVEEARIQPALILVSLSTLLSTVAIYRLAVMHNMTDSLVSQGPGSLSTPWSKAGFYIFHVLPEWLVSAVLLGCNVRQIFDTGPFGDNRRSDKETKSERKKRERKEREEREKGKISSSDVDLVMMA